METETRCPGCVYKPVVDAKRGYHGLRNNVGKISDAEELLKQMGNGQGYEPDKGCVLCVQGLMPELSDVIRERKRVAEQQARQQAAEKRKRARNRG